MSRNFREEFLKNLYYKTYPVLIRYGIKLVDDRGLVKDVIQDMFLRFYEKNLDLTEHPAPEAYVVKSFRRDLLRKHGHKEARVKVGFTSIQFTDEDLLTQTEDKLIKNNQVLHMLNSLSERQREIIWLHYYEDKSYQEIANILDVNYQSVLNNLQRAFRKIRTLHPGGMDDIW